MPLEGLRMPFCASRGFSSPSARLGPAGGVGESLVACSVRVSSLLSPRLYSLLFMLEKAVSRWRATIGLSLPQTYLSAR